MEDFESMTNNELLFRVKQLEAEHEALKIKMLNDYDKMEALEAKFDKIQRLLVRRLKG